MLYPEVGQVSQQKGSQHNGDDTNDCHYADNIFGFMFFNENNCILIQISWKFVPSGSMEN